MKKAITFCCIVITLLISLTGCKDNLSQKISVVSREDGSGTRGAFIEIFEIEEKNDNGEKFDKTAPSAEITNSTSVMISTIAGNKNAIGYISLGSLNDSVKSIAVDGNKASIQNIKNDSYKISRPFNIATKDNLSEIASDFISFILSKEGQEVIEKKGYVSSAENAPAYVKANKSGTITIVGSSSVAPVMETLKEAYIKINPNTKIQIQQSDSTSGMTSTIEGICDIGMASRELKESELSKGLKSTVIAIDGIAVIVNKESSIDTLSSEQIKKIFKGEITSWEELATK
ncbi:MAG: substrate-binding domain-containing protein [Oscillospiraceae bacterium]